MKNLNKKISIASLLTSSILLSSTAIATLGTVTNDGTTDANIQENDEVTIGFSHPQSLAISAPNNEVNRASNGVINRTWHVVSNNAVTVKFTGQSPDATGVVVASAGPTFYKAEVGADNAIITGQFDHLITNFAATVDISGTGNAHAGSFTGTEKWAGGAVTDTEASANTLQNATVSLATPITGTPATLISAGGSSFGSIMPNDDGRFNLTLSAKGVGDVATTQSGDYQITVVTSFMAAEKGNYTILAATAETANADGTTAAGFLTATQSYGDLGGTQADNSLFSKASSTGVNVANGTLTGGVEQSAFEHSTSATYEDTKASNVAEYADPR